MIFQLTLTDKEIQNIISLLKGLSTDYSTAEDPEFLTNAVIVAHDFPLRVRKFINDFRLNEPEDGVVCVVSGYPVDNNKIGLTPINRSDKYDASNTLEEQMLLILLGSLLGDPIGWSTQQAGHIIHDISPVQGQETDQTGSSSKEELFFHTEDAFHPYRGDYLGMMCLRNQNQAATTIASTRALSRLTQDQIRKLFEPCVVIRPDASQFEKHRFDKLDDLSKKYFEEFIHYSDAKIDKMNDEPEAIPILFGSPASPYIRIDCAEYMDVLDDEAGAAVSAFCQAIKDELIDLDLKAGEICFIDNYRAVHGRKPFKHNARYDGTDRWLKRINVARDLRKSRDTRMTSTSRIIF